MSLAKAVAVQSEVSEGVVLGSDTSVVVGQAILGKPSDAGEARSMLRALSGRTHTVVTGFALIDIESGTQHVGHERTDVTFRELDDDEIDQYVLGGSPMDKAGAYGIQDDFGAVFIERINGDYYTVVGLPLARVYVALRSIEESRRRKQGASAIGTSDT